MTHETRTHPLTRLWAALQTTFHAMARIQNRAPWRRNLRSC